MIERSDIISSTALKDFNEQLSEAIYKFQEDGLDVEIQYRPSTHGGELIFTALLLGRKELRLEKRNSN